MSEFESWRLSKIDADELPEMVTFQQIWEAGYQHALDKAKTICMQRACKGWPYAHAADCVDEIEKAIVNA